MGEQPFRRDGVSSVLANAATNACGFASSDRVDDDALVGAGVQLCGNGCKRYENCSLKKPRRYRWRWGILVDSIRVRGMTSDRYTRRLNVPTSHDPEHGCQGVMEGKVVVTIGLSHGVDRSLQGFERACSPGQATGQQPQPTARELYRRQPDSNNAQESRSFSYRYAFVFGSMESE